MSLRTVLCIAFFGLSLLMAPLQAGAQVLDASKIPVTPDYPMAVADFNAKTQLFQDTPGGDKFLTYSVRLPLGWKKLGSESEASVDTTKNLLGDLAHYYGPATLEGRSSFIMQVTEAGNNITAKNWFMNYILTRGYTLQFLKVLSERRIEAIYILLDKDVSYIVRAVIEVNGSRVVMAMYYIPETHWQAEKALQANCMQSLVFPTPEKPKSEATRTYAFLDLLRFDYPSSWRLQAPNIFSIETMSARVINSTDDTVLNGQIDVNVISTELDTNVTEEIKKVQKTLEEKGLIIGKLVEQPKDYKIHDHIYFNRIEVYQANDKDKRLLDYEYWIAVLIENRYYYIVTMLTPARTTDFNLWGRNSDAFKTVVESLRL